MGPTSGTGQGGVMDFYFSPLLWPSAATDHLLGTLMAQEIENPLDVYLITYLFMVAEH